MFEIVAKIKPPKFVEFLSFLFGLTVKIWDKSLLFSSEFCKPKSSLEICNHSSYKLKRIKKRTIKSISVMLGRKVANILLVWTSVLNHTFAANIKISSGHWFQTER